MVFLNAVKYYNSINHNNYYLNIIIKLFLVYIFSQEDSTPNLATIVELSNQCPQGATLMYAVVDNGNVSFYSFNAVNLPLAHQL